MDKAKLIMKPPHMEVRMKPGSWPDLEKMTETINKAGYKPIEGQVELIVTGTVVKQGDQLALELEGMEGARSLLVVPAKNDPETAAHLERHLGDQIEVEGLWQPAMEGGKDGLAVTAIYGAEDKRPKR